MKVTKWTRKIIAAIVAGGALAPSASYAVSIPLGDPSFEAYTVPTYVPPNGGFAYSDAYRPTSAWVDDLDSPVSPGGIARFQDDGVKNSNWLYSSAYGNDGPPYRGRPRTGNQAMHGLGNYNAQETTTNFAAEKLYTFSVWAQGDNDAAADDNQVYLYMFNGNVRFGEAYGGVVKSKGFQGSPGADFNKRGSNGPVADATASQNNWTKLTITHIVYPGDPVIGNPIGVGFYMSRDAAIDDASLDVDDAANHLLVLEVRTTDGQVRIRNQTAGAIKIDYYNIKSANSALNRVAWNSLQEQNLAGFPAGNGSGNGWEEAGGSSSTAVGESFLTGSSSVAVGTVPGLGAAFNVGGTHDLIFEYGALLSPPQSPTGDYNNNGVVDAGDYDVWRKLLNQNVTMPNDSTPGTVTQADYTAWRAHFGEIAVTPPSTLQRGLVHYVTSFSGSGSGLGGANVPEPTSVILVCAGMAGVMLVTRQRTTTIKAH